MDKFDEVIHRKIGIGEAILKMRQTAAIRRNHGGGIAVPHDLKILRTNGSGEIREFKGEETPKAATRIIGSSMDNVQAVNETQEMLKFRGEA